ncbi:Calx-beta domain-containing protein [Caenorhabditis elegans]|uniref:Calx-beta domain-containing protein n=1 Tax=Caenorhabditis elegans TaxID=6239 RepID=G5ECW0_CAEEL|nr:Calx-beta domain-containing protein [Caenorhabditis elegans]CAA94387.2 Calx-beta domain-containing protein [Caenorhabditis elegans]|eukprot:NP_501984.2 Na/Ca eXchangers [Caenorhabditis elegans]
MSSSANLTCKNGILIPALETTPRNAILYLAGLFYCFLGIAIAADIFMCSIEQITSATKKVKKQKKAGQLVAKEEDEEIDEQYDYVRIWNPTVANLTLMALGSSAPEILLSIIEIVGNGFKAGDLGPGTIVGSAAFNLFCISAICVFAVGTQTKRIELYRVFVVTAFFGTFAYIWVFLVLIVITPNVVDVWEAILTLLFFIILVVVSYAVDAQIWKKKKSSDLQEELEMAQHDGKVDDQPEKLSDEIKKWASNLSLNKEENDVIVDATPSVDTVRRWTRSISHTYPSLSDEDQAKILAYRVSRTMSHDRLYYRIRAIRQLSSSWRKSEEEEVLKMENQESTDSASRRKTFVEFSARVYRVDATDETVSLKIERKGNMESKFTVSYATVNGLAKKDLNFLFKSETLQFNPGELHKTISIQLINAANWRPNDVFYVHLKIQDVDEDSKICLGACNVAHVKMPDESKMILGGPVVEFVKPNYVVKENAGFSRSFVTRRGGKLKKPLQVHYETEDVTAKQGDDYTAVKDGILGFEGQEYEKYIDIDVIDDKMDEKDEAFIIELLKVDEPGVSIGTRRKATITIISDDNVLKNITNVRKLMGHYMRQLRPGKATWKEQILNAVSVNAGDLANATVSDCILHALAFPWKFAFAFLPPPTIFYGYPCFVVALIGIGLVTAVVGDVASIFGCMVGLKDAVTAITLVALGTSLPDTFASKIAAESDDTADNAVGNVTGSNSVNVFLGLGLPWVIASLYWASKGESFRVDAGDLGFSVTVFMICSVLFLVVLVLRRKLKAFGQGELGGPFGTKTLSALFFVGLWIVYVGLSIWKMYRKTTN